MSYSIVVPSAMYSEAPEVAPIEVHYLSGDELTKKCSSLVGFREFVGCTVIDAPRACSIYINKDLPTRAHRVVLRHEDAHCRGWPGDHPVQ